MKALVNGVMVSGSPEEIKKLIDLYKQSGVKQKVIDECEHNFVFNGMSESFKVQDGDILVHKYYICNKCGKEKTKLYCDPKYSK